MMQIPLSVPHLNGNELAYVTDAIQTEWVSTAGSYIQEFEQQMAAYVNAKGAVACQSGTAGLHLALMMCGVSAGTEVIVPALTFVAAVNPVRYLGAEPVFMDCGDELTMDANKLASFLEEECDREEKQVIHRRTGKAIRAIVVVHVFGNLADMDAIMEIADSYQLPVVEDATEAVGTYALQGRYAGRYAGTIGDIGVFSFNGNKIITSGGGGMLVSNREDWLNHCRHLSTQAKSDLLYFDHDEIGYNYRMTNLQAAVGLAQLEQLESFIAVKKQNYHLYLEAGIPLLPFRRDIRANYWFYSYESDYRDGLIAALLASGIQSRPVWKLIHTLKPYQGCESYRIEKAVYWQKRIVNLPCSSNLTEDEVKFVAQTIRQYQEGNL